MKQTKQNTFTDGMNLDLHPLVTPNTVLTDNLNGTLITYNGNEFCLQNDRGNTQTASLSDGFTAIGAKEHNGVIYIVSVKDDITEIGTYPGVDWSLNETSSEDEPVGQLNYNAYTPLGNLYNGNTRLNAFRIDNFYTKETPVTIEVQDSYDGSVNLVIIGGEKTPIIINSGFSVLSDDKYKLIDREQSADTNKYQVENLAEQLSLIRNSYTLAGEEIKLTNIELKSVEAGGQLKGGNYTFYLKFGDDDYNQTDIVAESGVVSIFNGTDGIPSTISGTLADERTDKMIQLQIDGLNHVYSKIYVYYTREYSDIQGYRMTEANVLVEPFEMESDSTITSQKIWISGFEQVQPIDINDLNVDYHTIDWAKAETQHSNMLFFGNVGQEQTFDLYRKLKNYTLDHVDTYVEFGSMKESGGDSFSHKNYYSTQNIYYSLGYWPEEWYRFGIVYILKDGSTTPVFNVKGGIFTNVGQISPKTNDSGVFKTPRADVLSSERPLCFRFVLNQGSIPASVKGWFVVRQKRIPVTICQGLSINIDKRSFLPLVRENNNWVIQSFLSLDRSVGTDVSGEKSKSRGSGDAKRRFVDEDYRHALRPLLEVYNKTRITNPGKGDCGKSPKTNIEYRFIQENKSSHHHGCGIVSLDPCVNSSIASVLNGSDFNIVREYNTTVPYDRSETNVDKNLIFEAKLQNGSFISNPYKINTKAAFIQPNTLVKSIDDYNFSNVAGNASDPGSFKYTSRAYGVYIEAEWFDGSGGDNYEHQDESQIGDEIYGTRDYYGYNSTHNVNLIRGKFMPYIGVTTDELNRRSVGNRGGYEMTDPYIYSIRHKDIEDSNALLVRSQDNSEYYSITKRIPITTQQQITYRGDCFICKVGMRVLSNFIDPVAPANDVILDPLSWELNVRQKSRWGGDNSGVDGKVGIVDYTDVNLSDLNAVDLGYWITFPCLSSYNLGLRSIDSFHTDEMAILGAPRSFYPLNGASTTTGNKMEESFLLNDGLSGTVGRKTYNLMPDVPYSRSEFSNRIIFSNVNVTDSYYNGYRVFQGVSYKDYDKQYGPITKLLQWGSSILCIMEHGIGIIPVNEKALIQTTVGEAIHIYGHDVLADTMTIVSQDYGSKYPHSVIRTPIGIYGVDTDARKIWKFSDTGFRIISDVNVETYLNDNLFTDVKSSIETVDVRTHYNAFKGDLMFTFYNTYKKYISAPSVLYIPVGDTKQLTITSNADNLQYSIGNSYVATLESNLYIKGLRVGETTLTISGDNIEKTVRIIVLQQQDVPAIPINSNFKGMPLSMTLHIGDTYIYTLSENINSNNLSLQYDNNVITTSAVNNNLKITGLSSGTTDLTIVYNGETVVSSITVISKSDENPEYDSGSEVIDPYENDNQVGNEYYTVYIHRPRLNSKLGSSYSDTCTIYVTYENETADYEFNVGREVHTFSFRKNSTIHITCDIPGYIRYDNYVKITSDKLNLYPIVTEYKNVLINSVVPSTAIVKVNDEEVNEGTVLQYPYGNLTTIEATADGYLDFTDTKQLFDDWVVDINLNEGDYYVSFSLSNYIYSSEGGYQTSWGAPAGTEIDYTITNTGETGTCTRDEGLFIPVHRGDSVTYTISAPGFNSISGYSSNVRENVVNKYCLVPSDYYEFRAHNIPNGYQFVMVNGGICWDTNVLNFRAGTELTIEVNGYDPITFTMPSSNVTIDVTTLVSNYNGSNDQNSNPGGIEGITFEDWNFE